MRDTKPLLALSVKAMRKREGECHGPHGRETPEEEEEVNISVTCPPVAVRCFGELKWLTEDPPRAAKATEWSGLGLMTAQPKPTKDSDSRTID